MVSTMTMTQTSSFSALPHQLRTYVVLTAKSSRSRLPSFTDLLEESPTSMKTTAVPDDCVAFESYAAVAARYQSGAATSPTRDLRWSDIARPRLYVASFLSANKTTKNGKPLSQKARKRQLRRAGTSSGSANDHLEIHALELCFEFLGLADLQRATLVCSEFRDVVVGSGRLLVGLYARKWQVNLPSAYYTLGFKPMLDMFTQRRADVEYIPVTTRSQVTKRTDATTAIVNNSLLRILTRSAVDSVRGTKALPVLSCARALGKQVGYFEVTMKGCGSVGVVSISDASTRSAYGYGSDEHVGWKGISYGYHGNDGDFVYNDGTAKYGGEWKPYGPSWGGMNTHDDADAAQFVVGCGLDMATHRLFFTLNGTFLGFAPVAVPAGEYAAAVSLHEFNDSAILNGGSAPFRYDIEGFCASL